MSPLAAGFAAAEQHGLGVTPRGERAALVSPTMQRSSSGMAIELTDVRLSGADVDMQDAGLKESTIANATASCVVDPAGRGVDDPMCVEALASNPPTLPTETGSLDAASRAPAVHGAPDHHSVFFPPTESCSSQEPVGEHEKFPAVKLLLRGVMRAGHARAAGLPPGAVPLDEAPAGGASSSVPAGGASSSVPKSVYRRLPRGVSGESRSRAAPGARATTERELIGSEGYSPRRHRRRPQR